MKHEPFVIERTYDAPVERVWKAITNKEQMKEWYFDMSDFEPEVGFEFTFTGEDGDLKFVHLCKVIEVVPERKLSHSWRYEGYEGDSLLTWEFFAEGEKTRVKLTHAGLETFPAKPSFARECFAGGWTEIFGKNLKEYVEKQ